MLHPTHKPAQGFRSQSLATARAVIQSRLKLGPQHFEAPQAEITRETLEDFCTDIVEGVTCKMQGAGGKRDEQRVGGKEDEQKVGGKEKKQGAEKGSCGSKREVAGNQGTTK